MKIIANIPDRLYESLKERPANHAEHLAVQEYICDGIPLTECEADHIPTITITIEEYIHLRECEDKCKENFEDESSLSSLNDLREDLCTRVIENHTVEFLENFSQNGIYQDHWFFFKNLLLQTERCLYVERAKERKQKDENQLP